MKHERGATLTELMMTVAVISIAGLGLAGTFAFIAKSVQSHRMRTLAVNLSQEQVEALKAKAYFALIPTSTPTYNSAFNPPIAYDTTYYPPQTISIEGNVFQRLTFVERVMSASGSLVPIPFDSMDTGLKRVTVNTIWRSGSGWRKITLTNLAANYDQPPLGGFQGTVTDTSGNPVPQATVFATQSASLHDVTDASGRYAFAVSPGSYSLTASAAGYFGKVSSTTYQMIGGSLQTVDFTLTAMATGTVTGAAYVNPHLLVSQVVSSSQTQTPDLATRDIEYAELFNPTTAPVNVGRLSVGVVQLSYKGETTTDDAPNIPLVYVSTFARSGGYYLIANATSFLLAGSWTNADAYYQTLYSDLIKRGKAGAIQLSDTSGNIFEGVGWTNAASGAGAPWSKGAAIAQASGLQRGDQLVRLSSAAALSSSYGRAYDSGDNASSFGYRGGTLLNAGGLLYKPWTAASSTQTVVAGAPAYGAIVTANDGLSGSTTAWKTTMNGFPFAAFSLVGVATGTWTVVLGSGTATVSISSVSVSTAGTRVTAIPNAATSPPWLLVNVNNALLTTTSNNGYIGGTVTDGNLAPLTGVEVDAEPNGSGMTNSQGFYAISVPPGTYSVLANPGSISAPHYGSASINAVVSLPGQYDDGNNLVLSGAGGVTGYVCDFAAANPYPGVAITAADANGNVWAQAVSGSDGRFSITGLSTGTFTIAPVLDTSQSSTPSGQSVAVPLGSSVFAGTFTVTGAYGVIAGAATSSGAPITTGVLIVATTGTVTSSLPPAISSTSLGGAPYYMTSSLSDGSFTLTVRASTASANFNVYGWYTTYTGDTANTPVIKRLNVSVTGGQTTQAGLQW